MIKGLYAKCVQPLIIGFSQIFVQSNERNVILHMQTHPPFSSSHSVSSSSFFAVMSFSSFVSTVIFS